MEKSQPWENLQTWDCPQVSNRALEVYVRRVYRAHNVETLNLSQVEGAAGNVAEWTFRFRDTPPNEAPLRRCVGGDCRNLLLICASLMDLCTFWEILRGGVPEPEFPIF